MTTLKNILLLNAVSSGATGLGLVAAPDLIANLFGATQKTPFVAVGVFLVAFAAFVFFVSRKNPPTEGPVRLITMLDTLWTLASAAIVILQLFDLSAWGYFLISAVAMWVALMAYLQYNGLKQNSITSKKQ